MCQRLKSFFFITLHLQIQHRIIVKRIWSHLKHTDKHIFNAQCSEANRTLKSRCHTELDWDQAYYQPEWKLAQL